MATQTTGGGSTTSFTNTPQAKDDSYNYDEDTLYNDCRLYDRASKTIFLDVMANDLGGNAKTLFSVDDGGTGALADLLKKETAWEQTADGHWIRVYNGKVEFKIGDGTGVFANARDVNSLGADECVEETFMYAIRMANGTLAYATVTIKIQGENDAVELGAVTGATIDDTAADDTFGDITGTLTSTDPDANDEPTYSLDHLDAEPSDDAAYDVMRVTDYGTLYLNSETGAYRFVPNDAAINALDSGDDPVELDFAVSVSDGDTSDSDTLTITINGANDAVELAAVTGQSIDDTSANDTFSDLTGSLVGSDRDDGEVLEYGLDDADAEASDDPAYDVMRVTDYGTLYLNSETGAYRFVPNDAAINALDSGDDPVELDFAVSVSDGDTSDSDTLTITINGANDAVELAAVTGQSIDDTSANDTFSDLTGSLVGSDRDDGEVLEYGLDDADAEASDDPAYDVMRVTDYGTLYLNSETGAYRFVPNDAAINALDSGDDPVELDFAVSVSDGDTSDSDTLTITINGANDAVELAAVTGQSIDDTSANDTFSDLTGSLVGSDRDDGEVLEYGLDDADAEASDDPAYDVMRVTDYGTLYLNSETGAYRFVPNDAAINALDSGDDPVELDFAVSVSDGDTSDSDTLTITINGANDAVVTGGPDEASGTEDDASIGGTVPAAGDVDGDAITYELVAGSVEIDGQAAADGVITFNSDGSYSYDPSGDQDLDDGETRTITFSYVANDGDADSAPATVTITVNGVNDAPADALAPTDIKFALGSSAGTFTTNLTAGSTLGSLTAVDADSASWTFTLGGTDASLFTISPGAGGTVNLLVGGANITDVPGKYTFSITATDAGGNSYTENFTLSVGSSNGSNGDSTTAFLITSGSDIDFALNGPDQILGGSGEDALVGGNGTDTLNGELGNDQLFGGLQGDNFVFNTAITGGANVDRILDFNANNADQIQLDDAIFGGLTSANLASNFQSSATGTFAGTAMLQYNSTTGELYYDSDGAAGATPAVLFAQITLVGGTFNADDFGII